MPAWFSRAVASLAAAAEDSEGLTTYAYVAGPAAACFAEQMASARSECQLTTVRSGGDV